MTLVGAVAALTLLIAGYAPHRHGGCFYFNVGQGWGGVNLGLFCIVDSTSGLHTKNHEFGHSIQNCYFGFLMPIVVGLPSVIRYWYRNMLVRTGTPATELPAYDSVWFEDQATKLGYANIAYWQ